MDILSLFQAAWKKFGIIHSVVSNAGVNTENLFEDEIDPKTGILMPPNLKSVEINLTGMYILHSFILAESFANVNYTLTGMIYAVKCAEHYFAKWPETRCQIIMTGSAASYLDTPPLYLYCAAKTGLLGLIRGLRTQLIKKNITINLVCPWLTGTQQASHHRESRLIFLNCSNTHAPSRNAGCVAGFAIKRALWRWAGTSDADSKARYQW